VNIWADSDVKEDVKMWCFPVEGSNHKAAIVLPGGSYFWHDMDNEGFQVAHWLQSKGIAAFVLRYRTAYVPAFVTHFRLLFRGNRYPDPQDDLRQALRYVRQHAQELGINADSVGVMGFSAGGHLAMSAVELFPREEWPAFVAAIYPVVSMSADCTHKRSRRGLLGDNHRHNARLQDSLSMERHVPKNCPPVFLVNCKDDPIVDYRNSVLLDSALTAQGVPHVYIQYSTGGHGFGANPNKGSAESQGWRKKFEEFIARLEEGGSELSE
jgi:acetyl esterase/lipase